MILKSTIAAIEMAGNEARVAVVRVGGRHPELLEAHTATAVYEDPAERDAALGRALDQALEKIQARVVSYVHVVSSGRTIVRNITIPFRGARRVAAAVKFELEPYLALPIEELTVDFVQVGEFDGQTEVLAVAMRNDHLAQERAILEMAGIEPDAVTVDAAALTALWSAGRTLKGLQAVLHLREHDACVAIVHNRKLAFFRNLPYSAQMVAANPDALARDVSNTLRAFTSKWRGGGEVEKLSITGVSLGPAETAALAETVAVPVESMRLLAASKLPGEAAQITGAEVTLNKWEALVGAAHAAAAGGFHLDLARESGTGSAMVRAAAGHVLFSCGLAFVLLCGWGFYYYQGAQQNRALIAQLEAQTAQLNDDILALQARGLPEGIETAVFTDPPLLDVLRELGRRLPPDRVNVTEIRVGAPTSRNPWLTVEGEVGNSGQLVEIYNDLKTSPLFSFESEPDVRVQGAETFFTLKMNRPVDAAIRAISAAAQAIAPAEAPAAAETAEAPAAAPGSGEPAAAADTAAATEAEAATPPAPETEAAAEAPAPTE